MPKRFSLSLPRTTLADYVANQCGVFYPDKGKRKPSKAILDDALARLEHCFQHVRIKGFWVSGAPRFNHLHTDQYAIFLYYLSNSAFQRGDVTIAAKTYALNKALHGLDAFYEVALPAIFAVVHPVGTVLGRATYGDYFCAYQNVSVGADPAHAHPIIGSGVLMYGGSRIIGAARIGDDCVISAGATILGGEVLRGHVAFGQHPNVTTKPTRWNARRDVFKDPA